jgi:hypothetical protein
MKHLLGVKIVLSISLTLMFSFSIKAKKVITDWYSIYPIECGEYFLEGVIHQRGDLFVVQINSGTSNEIQFSLANASLDDLLMYKDRVSLLKVKIFKPILERGKEGYLKVLEMGDAQAEREGPFRFEKIKNGTCQF